MDPAPCRGASAPGAPRGSFRARLGASSGTYGGTGDPEGARGMCGRFTQVVKAVDLAALYGVAASGVELQPRWNGAPTQAFLVSRLDAVGRRVLTLQRWGLVPSWAGDRELVDQHAVGGRSVSARISASLSMSLSRMSLMIALRNPLSLLFPVMFWRYPAKLSCSSWATCQLQKKPTHTCVHCTKYGVFGPR